MSAHRVFVTAVLCTLAIGAAAAPASGQSRGSAACPAASSWAELLDAVPLHLAATADPVHHIATVHVVGMLLEDVVRQLRMPDHPEWQGTDSLRAELPRFKGGSPSIASATELSAHQFVLHRDGRVTGVERVKGLSTAALDSSLVRAVAALGTGPLIPAEAEADSLVIQLGFRTTVEGAAVHALVGTGLAPHSVMQDATFRPVVVGRTTLPAWVGASGSALLTAMVDHRGRIDRASIEVVEASSRRHASASVGSLRNWRFEPARIGGCAIPVLMEFPFTYLYDDR